MDKIRDTMDDADEISRAISQPLGVDLVDEGELEDQLEALENEILNETKVDIPKSDLSKVSNGKTATTTSNQKVAVGVGGSNKNPNVDDELARFEAELGL
jgi:hypothetical protein